jgi:hypothetical protein
LLAVGGFACGESTPGPNNNNNMNPDGGMTTPPQPVDQAQSAQRSAKYAGDIVRQLGGAVSFAGAENGVLSRLAGGVMGMRGGSDEPPVQPLLSAPLPRPLLDQLMETPSFKSLRPRPSFLAMATPEENFDDAAADIEAFFKTRLFVAGNVETSTSTSVTYLLKGDPTCRPLPSDISNGEMDRIDLQCAGDLNKLQVRIVVTSDGDGYRFQILLGPDKFELSVFIIHSDELAWEADLAMARLATQFANMALMREGAGERREGPFPFSVLKGRVKVALKKLGEKKASISWSVLEALEIQDNDHHSFAMKPASPVIALTGDGVAKTITLKLGIPQTDLRGPWDPKDLGAQNGDLHVMIGGLHGESTLSEMAEELAFTGLGVAPSFVEVRSTKIFELGFNTANGNKMDLKIKPIAGDQARFEIAPRFDLSLLFGLQHVAGDFNSPPDDFLQNQTYSVLMMGGSRVVVETVQETDTFAGGFKMVEGSLKLSTSASAEATVEVPAGQCLTENPEPAEGSHGILGNIMAASCPAAP